MNATKRAQVPFGLRKKLMAATSMLLVAAIMLVSTSYAWFTLSTAPEITGITTSVGANGNLEIALLTTETFTNPDLITSNTGDSMANTNNHTVKDANITWGNLVDLSDGYGLDKIVMYPAALNSADGAVNLAPLSVPKYGSDGRVIETEGNTITAVMNESGVFAQPASGTDYGVRAVGTSAAVSARELILRSAKGSLQAKATSASAPIRNAVNANITPFLMLAAEGGAPDTYSYEQVKAMKDIATGVKTSLGNIVAAYSYAAVAKAATTDSISDELVSELNTTIAGKTDAATIISTLGGENYAAANEYGSVLTDLKTQQTEVQSVIDALDGLLTGKDSSATFGDTSSKQTISDAINTLLGSGLPIANAEGQPVDDKMSILKGGNYYLTGGVVGGSTKSDGVVPGVAYYSGTFFITEELKVRVHAGAVNTTGALSSVVATVNGYTYSNTSNTTVSITDNYGYIIDFAFRTNAASSFLQLQTSAVNRVYSDSEDVSLATQGNGSTLTFDFTSATDLTAEQAKNLLEAVRVVFFDPSDGEIYKTAKVDNISVSGTVATGELYLIDTTNDAYELGKEAYTGSSYAVLEKYTAANTISGDAVGSYKTTITAEQYAQLAPETSGEGTEASKYTLGKDAYEATEYTLNENLTFDGSTITKDQCTNATTTIADVVYNALKSKTTKTTSTTLKGDEGQIVELPQNTVLMMSALVYLDGANIDNSAVSATGTSSGDLSLNLQFSSSAELVPMENSALRTETKNTNP